MTQTNTAPTQINAALQAVKTRFVRVNSNTAYPRFRDVVTGIEQADPGILYDWYRKNSNSTTPTKSSAELLNVLSWVYGDGFQPNGPVVLSGNLQNLWQAPHIKPSGKRVLSTKVQPFLEFMDRWFPIDSERNYFLWWMAHTVRCPEVRIIATPVLRSDHGTGKGFFAESLMTPLLGRKSVAQVALKEVVGDFNDVLEGKTFIMIDEVYKSKKSTTDALKSFQGNSTFPLRRKHKPTVTVDNYVNFIVTSNGHIPLAIEDGDRRFWIPQFIKHSESPQETGHFINAVFKPWLLSGGLQVVRDYLESVDLGQYRATDPAPTTASKNDISGLNQADQLPETLKSLIEEKSFKVVTVGCLKSALTAYTEVSQYQLPSDPALVSALLEIGCIAKRTNSGRYYITPIGTEAGLSKDTSPKDLAYHCAA
jgi:hypothetical protein